MLLDISRPSRQEHELFQAEVRELRSEVTRLKTMLSVGGTAAAIILSVAIFVANQQLNALESLRTDVRQVRDQVFELQRSDPVPPKRHFQGPVFRKTSPEETGEGVLRGLSEMIKPPECGGLNYNK